MSRLERLERLIGEFPGMVYRCKHDADWTLEFASSGSLALLGYTPDELVVERSVAITDLVHRDDLSAVSLEVERAITEARPFRMQYRMRTRDGHEKWISEVGRGVVTHDGSLIALEGFLTDITEQVLAQRAVFEATRNQSIGKFASGIAHDLNNMLTSLNMITAALGREFLANDLESLQLVGQQIAKLSKQLANLGAGTTAAGSRLDLGDLVDHMVPVLKRLIDGGSALHVTTARGLIMHAEPVRLEQAVMNLVVNASDALGGRGRIDVVVAAIAPDVASLSVSDDGRGIAPEVLETIFDPFFTTKAKERGTGLGLMVVEQVVKELGGKVTVTSELGKGARFELQLPLIADASSFVTPASLMGSEVVLLVDDDPILRAVLARGLRRLGYTVLESADGELALRLSERHHGLIDVLVTDYKMPNLSGLELARAFKDQRGVTRRILMTGDDVAAPTELFDARLRKPFAVEQLASTVREVIARDRKS